MSERQAEIVPRCDACGWPTPTGACGRCLNERAERSSETAREHGRRRVRTTEKVQIEQLAHDLLRAKHDDNPEAPFPMVRSGCALVLAEALYALGWHPSTPPEKAGP